MRQYICSFLISFLVNLFVISIAKRKAFCVDCGDAEKPQRFHTDPTSRAGGLGIFLACAAILLLGREDLTLDVRSYFLIVSSIPAFMIGFYEDFRANVSARTRLLFMSVGAVVAIINLDAVIYDTGLFSLPLWFAVPFTIFAVSGVTNSINIIDGFNGLASGVAIISLLFFASVAYGYGDYFILTTVLTLVFSISGFFVLNFPRGRIFLGDGGAYFIGFMLVMLSIVMINRHPEMSPLFPVTILMYPVFETLFSIYRRKFKRRLSPLAPDRIHLHSLIHMRIAKINSKTALYIWPVVLAFDLAALLFKENTISLVCTIFVFVAFYLYIYGKIVRFGFKKW